MGYNAKEKAIIVARAESQARELSKLCAERKLEREHESTPSEFVRLRRLEKRVKQQQRQKKRSKW